MKHLRGVLFVCIASMVLGNRCYSQDLQWRALVGGEVEFGVTALLDGALIQSPSAFESGYNGAWWFGNSEPIGYTGMGQTFTVSSLRTLDSIQLRINGSANDVPTGEFLVAVYRFDTTSGFPVEQLASSLANADDYMFDLQDVPISTFDLSSAGVTLYPTEAYALAVTPTASFTGGMWLQAATDIYPNGLAYSLARIIPEPTTFTLLGLGALAVAMVGRRKEFTRPHPTAPNLEPVEASNFSFA